MSATLYREAALTDARSDRLRVPVSVLVQDDRIVRIRPTGDEGELPAGCEVVEAGGTTIVPGLVDGHNHVTLPGGSHWIADGERPTEWLLDAAEHNGELLHRAACGGSGMSGRCGGSTGSGSGRSASGCGSGGGGGGTGRSSGRRAPG
jgi:cytosine/adenosine deaminase-related metal-dependent hydrolase